MYRSWRRILTNPGSDTSRNSSSLFLHFYSQFYKQSYRLQPFKKKAKNSLHLCTNTHTPKKNIIKTNCDRKTLLNSIKIDIENYRYTIYVTEYLTIHWFVLTADTHTGSHLEQTSKTKFKLHHIQETMCFLIQELWIKTVTCLKQGCVWHVRWKWYATYKKLSLNNLTISTFQKKKLYKSTVYQ